MELKHVSSGPLLYEAKREQQIVLNAGELVSQGMTENQICFSQLSSLETVLELAYELRSRIKHCTLN